ncbi:EAL and HDOD domain-containing protein [Thalassotalea agarivorans]|uniref:EAL domain-containing protein n=1 Tax=Thalassotalea agarivorans TaxID=349064 RepID=A0A1H9YL13_THASX|nr:EAL domain-containing protein [Thalassotalea agarivorans]SES69742.1 EAL domain-containing protein [Thalassotalea agarivorans]
MQFFAARQPILDKNKNLYAYELLFRDSDSNAFPDIDGDEATQKMVTHSNHINFSKVTENKPAFINFTMGTLVKGYPKLLNKADVVIEILESVKPCDELLSLCRELHNEGYTIALDDYEHQDIWKPFYPYIDIIKIDVQQSTLNDIGELKTAIEQFPHIKLLAEKIETQQEFQQVKDLGCELFQGFLFSPPEMVMG